MSAKVGSLCAFIMRKGVRREQNGTTFLPLYKIELKQYKYMDCILYSKNDDKDLQFE